MALPQAIDIRISMLRLAPQCFAFTSIMYVVEMLQTSLRLYVSTYVAATINLLRALTVGVHSTDVLFE